MNPDYPFVLCGRRILSNVGTYDLVCRLLQIVLKNLPKNLFSDLFIHSK